ncbi:hypothetical protein [Porphyrobacter sp. AAP60]|uniref:hypothetical protein n=1 Tax=Porphyrobacter sp. AAP60 TaxID=1523423 RepID=UPI0006B96E61|nr:hypothetical protein [Porphyrobacter sp. AAP60]KPF61634.1 hypothetical protein IP79_14930 [Porphyrobacter sp. AAP60]
MDLENILSRLVALSVPDLSAIDGATLATQARVEALQSRRALGAAMVAALGIGVAGGMQIPAQAETSLIAFGPAPSLTPLIALGKQ